MEQPLNPVYDEGAPILTHPPESNIVIVLKEHVGRFAVEEHT